MGEDAELDDLPGANPSRAQRAKLLSGAALVVVAVAAVLYARPALPTGAPAPAPAPRFQLDAVDFVSPTTGWVLEDLDDFEFAVLATTDGGRHWKPQLLEPTVLQGEYMRFFDARHGVVATVGGEPFVYATADGGATWRRDVVYDPNSFGISASFADPLHGWELIGVGPDVPLASPVLVRTADGGRTWTRLGAVPAKAQPFAVAFSDDRHGWLDTVSHSPVAYATDDAGATWHAVSLPKPRDGWPVPNGVFFVALRPTAQDGVVASVVNSVAVSGRNPGLDVLAYPPLTVRTFDGGAPVEYEYGTLVDTPFSGVTTANRPGINGGSLQAANQTVMRSTDGGDSWTVVTPPSPGGTLGFAGPRDWWWIGPNVLSTTHDGGLSWTQVQSIDLPQPSSGSLVVLDPEHAWVTGTARGSTLLYTTVDGGAHWTAVALPSLNL